MTETQISNRGGARAREGQLGEGFWKGWQGDARGLFIGVEDGQGGVLAAAVKTT